MNKLAILLSGVSIMAFAGSASAEDFELSVQSILSTMSAAGGTETLQWQVAPSYSELFGAGVRTTVGGYVAEDFALGVIIDYAAHREEYLANAGAQLNGNMRVIGSFGLLKESEEFTLGDGRDHVQQLQYGLSLKGDYDAGLFRGYEINAYRTNGSSDTDAVETGDLAGLQIITQLKPSDSADIRLGAGYERAEWAGGDVDEGVTLQVLGSLRVSDVLSLSYAAKSAETENSYGLGLSYDISTRDVPNSLLSISFNEIEGKHGISDDTRVAINWTVGLGGAAGAGSDASVSSMGGMPSIARSDLLADVMTRPAFLPERVLARATGAFNSTACLNELYPFAPSDRPLIGAGSPYDVPGTPNGTYAFFIPEGDSIDSVFFGGFGVVVDEQLTMPNDISERANSNASFVLVDPLTCTYIGWWRID